MGYHELAHTETLRDDHVESTEVSSNGTRSPIDEGPSPQDGQSMDERLAALEQAIVEWDGRLKHTIEHWDWRSASVPPGPSPANVVVPAPEDAPSAPTAAVSLPDVPQPAAASVADVRAAREPLQRDSITVGTDVEVPEQVVEPVTLPVPVVPPQSGRPTCALEEQPRHSADAAEDAAGWLGVEPEEKYEPDGRVHRLWSHPWAKTAALSAAAVVAALGIIWGVRLLAGGGSTSTSGSSTPATVSRSSASVALHSPAPISAAQLAKYDGYAQGLQRANVLADKQLADVGSSPTVSELTPRIATYRSALNLYYFQLHFIDWPASLRPIVDIDEAQLQDQMTYLSSLSSSSTASTTAWLSELRGRSASTQSADNEVRSALGLPVSRSFP